MNEKILQILNNVSKKCSLTKSVFGENIVQNTIRSKFQPVCTTYLRIQHLELRLALIKFLVVSFLQSDSCVRLVHFHGKCITNPLNLSNTFLLAWGIICCNSFQCRVLTNLKWNKSYPYLRQKQINRTAKSMWLSYWGIADCDSFLRYLMTMSAATLCSVKWGRTLMDWKASGSSHDWIKVPS